MSDNPFISPDNPTGAWARNYEEFDQPVGSTVSIANASDSVVAMAGAAMSPLGPLAVLRLQFTNSATGHLVEVDLISSPEQMLTIGRTINDTATAASRSARKHRK